MGKNTSAGVLDEAHEELEKAIETQEKSRLAKSLDSLRARFGFGPPAAETEEVDLSKANAKTMAGNGGYPQDAVNEGNISRARSKSKPAKLPDGNYDDLPKAESDTTDYENSEEDALDGFDGKKITEKAGKKSFKGQTEDDFYKAIIDGDESGEVVEAINASDALELLASSMGKSVAYLSQQSEALGLFANEQFVELSKSMAVLAEAVGTIMEALEKGQPGSPVPAASAEVAEVEERKTGEESTEEVAEKSLSDEENRYKRTLSWLVDNDHMNAPSFFSQLSGQSLQKSEGEQTDNTPEALNTFSGRQRVKQAITTLVKSEGLNPDYLGALDTNMPSQVVAALPRAMRSKVGLD